MLRSTWIIFTQITKMYQSIKRNIHLIALQASYLFVFYCFTLIRTEKKTSTFSHFVVYISHYSLYEEKSRVID